MRMKIVILLLLLMSAATIFGETYSGTLTFDRNKISYRTEKGYDLVEYRDKKSYYHTEPGAPYLPKYAFKIVVPNDMVVTKVTVNSMSKRVVDWSFNAYPAQEIVPLDQNPAFITPDSLIYSANTEYPYNDTITYLGDTKIRGYKMAGFGVNLFSYNPIQKDLYFLDEISYTVEYQIAPPGTPAGSVDYGSAPNDLFREMVISSVENPEDADSFYTTSSAAPGGSMYGADQIDLLIVTSNLLKPNFEEYALFREDQTNLVVKVVAIEEIYPAYPGNTNQLKIKNCIYDYMKNHNTTYVLLGGDTNIIPDQDGFMELGIHTFSYDMPVDLFYTCFDDTFDWNADGDQYVGEPEDNIDLGPDIFIGRLPFSTPAHVTDYQNKVAWYYDVAHKSDYKMKGLLLTGAELWNYGDAEAKSERMFTEHIAPYWPDCRKETLYDSTTFLNGQVLKNKIQFFNAVHMACHGSETAWYLESGVFSRTDALALQGRPIGVVATMACFTNAFDYADGLSLGESFILNPDGGSLVYIGSSRYGWGEMTLTDHGPSFQYNNTFFEYLLNDDDSNKYVSTAGAAFGLTKYLLAPVTADSGMSRMRWVHLALNFLGDPTITFFERKEHFSWERVKDFDAIAVASGADGSVYALGDENTAAGGGVYKWNGAVWNRLYGQNGIKIDIDPAGNPWIVNKNGNIYKWTGSYWQNKPGSAKDIAIGGNGVVYMIDKNAGGPRGNYIAYWDGSKWVHINSVEAVSIAVNEKGNPWIVDNTSHIARYNGTEWESLPGLASDITAGPDGTIFITGLETAVPDNNLYRWNDYGWQKLPGEGVNIEAGPAGHAYYVNNRGDLFFGEPEENIIRNGDFSSTHYSSWVKYDLEGGASILSSIPESGGTGPKDLELKVSITQGGTQTWSVLVTEPHLEIEKGETYTVSFWAKQANSNGLSVSSDITVSLDAAPWTEYGAMSATFTNEYKRYSFTFTMEHETDDEAVFQFCLGKIKRDVYIDTVSIVKHP